MTYQLTEQQIRLLESKVAAGGLASVEEAIAVAIAGLDLDTDDLDWAVPLIAEAEAEFARGEGIPSSVVRADVEALLKSR